MVIVNDNILQLFINPGIFLIILSLGSLLFKHKIIKSLFLLLPFIAFIMLALHFSDSVVKTGVILFDHRILVLDIKEQSFLVSSAFLIVYLCVILFSSDYKEYRWLYSLGGVICGSAIIAVNAMDYLTYFLGIELITISSIFLIFIGDNSTRYEVGFRYAITHIFSGLLFFIGIIICANINGSYLITPIEFPDFLSNDQFSLNKQLIGGLLILFALLINCAMPPFSNWLIDAYSTSNPYHSLMMVSYTTKVAIFMILKLFVGNEILAYCGIFTMFYASIFVLINGNFRKILCYGMVGQLGLMMIGVATGLASAEASVTYLIFTHIIYNLILFMSVVKLNAGHHVDKKIFALIIIGFISSIALPLTGSYVAKALVMNGIKREIFYIITLILIAATIAGNIKLLLPYFEEKKSVVAVNAWHKGEIAALSLLVLLSILTGILPQFFYPALGPYLTQIFDYNHIVGQLVLIALTLLVATRFRKFLGKNDVTIPGFEWLAKKILFTTFFQITNMFSYVKKKLFNFLENYVISPSWYLGSVSTSTWSVGLVISCFLLAVILLFLLIHI